MVDDSDRTEPLPLNVEDQHNDGHGSSSAGIDLRVQSAPAQAATEQSATVLEHTQHSAQGHAPDDEGGAMTDL